MTQDTYAKFFGELRSFLATAKYVDPDLRNWLQNYQGELPDWESWLNIFVPYIKDSLPTSEPIGLGWMYDPPNSSWQNAHYFCPWVTDLTQGPLEFALVSQCGCSGFGALDAIWLGSGMSTFGLDILRALKDLPQPLYLIASLTLLFALEAKVYEGPQLQVGTITLSNDRRESELFKRDVLKSTYNLDWNTVRRLRLEFPSLEDFYTIVPSDHTLVPMAAKIVHLSQRSSWEALKDLQVVIDHTKIRWGVSEWTTALERLAAFAPGNPLRFELVCRESFRVDLRQYTLEESIPYLLQKLNSLGMIRG